MTDDLVVKAKCEACQAAGIVALAIAPEYVLQLLSKIERLQSTTEQLESLVFWMDELLGLARELQKDLKRFYEPIKGWPPHIEALEGTTDFDTVLETGKQFLRDIKQDL